VCQNVVMDTAVGLRERKKARTREALQEAAMDLFTRQGFDGTTVEEIADACEVSPRTFFRYFPTKEDVLFADTEARRERLLAVLADQPADVPPLAALHAAMRGLALDYRHDRAALVARAKVIEGSPQLQAYKAEHQHGWEAAVVDALERRPPIAGGSVTRAELELLAAISTAAMRVTVDGWVADASGPDLDERLDRAFAHIVSGFASTASG
jgi:AcrR family transcriptional regulator